MCHKQLDFGRVEGLEIIADFEGGEITSDSGAILLKEIDRKYQVTEDAAACLVEGRAVEKIKHELMTILRQRVFQIAMGYEDQNDATYVRKDPSLKVMVDRCPDDEDRNPDVFQEVHEPGPAPRLEHELRREQSPNHVRSKDEDHQVDHQQREEEVRYGETEKGQERQGVIRHRALFKKFLEIRQVTFVDMLVDQMRQSTVKANHHKFFWSFHH